MTVPPVPSPPSAFAPQDRELLAAYGRHGDEAAFSALVQRHLGLVMGTAIRRTGDAHLAEEVAQITFGVLARKAATLGRVESLPAWLHRVALVQSIRALRQLARHRRKLELAMHNAQLHHDPRDLYEEALPWLDQALDGLAEADRQLLVLRYYEGLSFAEASRRLGRSEAALRQHARRAVERLSAQLRRRGVAVPAGSIIASLGASMAGPRASAASASFIARAALTTAPGITGATLWFTSLLTMSTMKSLALGAAAALVLASIPLGWQRMEATRLTAAVRSAAAPVSPPRALRKPHPNHSPSPSPLTSGPAATRDPGGASDSLGAAHREPGEALSAPMEEVLHGFFRRKAAQEADRTALSLGLLPEQTVLYRDFIEKRYRDRTAADSDEDRARLRREDRRLTEDFVASLLGPDGAERHRAMEQRRDEAAIEKASGDALHTVAHIVDLAEPQKQSCFAIFAAAARDDAAAGRASSFSLSFGYGADPGPRLTDDESVLSSILSAEQMALWQRHGAPDPDMARKALELVAPMVAGNPEIWKQMEQSAEPTAPPLPDQ